MLFLCISYELLKDGQDASILIEMFTLHHQILNNGKKMVLL